MSKPIIEVNNISKKYRLGNIGVGSFIDDLKGVGKKIGLPYSQPDPAKQFQALDDVSFTVEEGEVLGIIGHNGAGKSTLLKILSRITEPTSGSAVLRGRVASLLEVGTGFNGELTGRENIFLNGALYGLSRVEIKKKLESIIDFSQVEGFIDTPVKRYSSGMYVRLAFAVAAHLQPEILILDEILAVGDLAFQNKCLNMIRDISKNGRTVLFVSHNIRMINRLCTRGLVLENGKSIFDGDLNLALDHYIGKVDSKIKHEFCSVNNKDSHIHVQNVQLLVNGELNKKPILCFDKIDIIIEVMLNISLQDIIISMVVKNSDKEIVFMSEINDDDGVNPESSGLYKIKTFIPNPLLKPSKYSLTIGTNSQSMGQLNHFEDIIYFEIIDINTNRDQRPGFIYQKITWSVEKVSY